jgi:hypothetical protein
MWLAKGHHSQVAGSTQVVQIVIVRTTEATRYESVVHVQAAKITEQKFSTHVRICGEVPSNPEWGEWWRNIF